MMVPIGTAAHIGSVVKRRQPLAIPVPLPVAWLPLLSSRYQPRRSTVGMDEQPGVPTGSSSTYSLVPLAPCETSFTMSCADNAVENKKAARKNAKFRAAKGFEKICGCFMLQALLA